MKKMIAIIILLFIIFISMVIYKNYEKNAEVKVDEVNEIEEYIKKIYCWKEVTNEALPTFEDINNADEKWIWEAVKKNLEEYNVTAEQLENKGKDIFGNKFSKKYSNEKNDSFEYNQDQDKYVAKEIQTDLEEDLFLLNKINKTMNGYEVEIIEYLEDYSNSENNQVIIKNLNEEIIETLDTQDIDNKVIDVLKENKEKFTTKKIILKFDKERMYVQKVEG